MCSGHSDRFAVADGCLRGALARAPRPRHPRRSRSPPTVRGESRREKSREASGRRPRFSPPVKAAYRSVPWESSEITELFSGLWQRLTLSLSATSENPRNYSDSVNGFLLFSPASQVQEKRFFKKPRNLVLPLPLLHPPPIPRIGESSRDAVLS